MPTNLPSSAVCRGCRYALRNLETNVCPECGVAFDPGDPNSYIDDPRLNKRRRIVKWVVILLAVGAVVFVFCPRGVRRGTMTYTFSDGNSLKFTRKEFVPATWLPLRYPGFVSQAGTVPKPLGNDWRLTAHFEFESGSAGGMTVAAPGRVPTINDQAAYPDNAPLILRKLMSPQANTVVVRQGRPSSTASDDM